MAVQLVHGTALQVRCTKGRVLISPVLTKGNALRSTLNICGAPEMRLAVPVGRVTSNLSVMLLARGRVSRCSPAIGRRLTGGVLFLARPRSGRDVARSNFAGMRDVRGSGTVKGLAVRHVRKRRNFKGVKRVVKPMSNCMLATRNFPAVCVVDSYG